MPGRTNLESKSRRDSHISSRSLLKRMSTYKIVIVKTKSPHKKPISTSLRKATENNAIELPKNSKNKKIRSKKTAAKKPASINSSEKAPSKA